MTEQIFDWLKPEQYYKPTDYRVRIIESELDAEEAEEFLMSCVLIAEDIETLPDLMLMNVVGFSGLRDDGVIRTYVFPLYMAKNPASGTPSGLLKYLQVIKRVNESGIPLVFQNGAYDIFWLVRYGIPVANYYADTMTLFWSIFPEYPKDLAFISSICLDDYVYWKGDRKSDSWYTHLLYNGKDCDRTLRAVIVLLGWAARNEQMMINNADAHRRVLAGLNMSMRGMKVDPIQRDKHGEKLAQDAEARLARLRYLVADENFNPNSTPQKKALLYTKMGGKMRNARGRFVNKLEAASTGAVAMRAMRHEHPVLGIVVQAIMDVNEPSKQISNVIKMKHAPWKNHGPRFYTSYNGVGTTTTRYGSSQAPIGVGGNGQNIRKDYRNILVADSDSFLLDIDLSAGDDVFVTFESGDPRKIELFRTGRDSHAQNATLFFPNWTYDAVVAGKKAKDSDPELYKRVTHPITGIRQITKKLSHGCNYLMAGLTLLMTAGREAIVAAAKELGHADAGYWDQARLAEFCESLEAKYRNYYTRFKREGADSWYTDLYSEFKDTGGFTTPFGYFQRFLLDSWDRNVIRALAATAGQAGTAGRINMAMDELLFGIIRPSFRDHPNPCADDKPAKVSQAEHGIDLRLQTHDSLTFNIRHTHPNWREGVRNIFIAMSRPVIIQNKLTGGFEEFRVNLETEVGLSWGTGLKGTGNSVEAVELTLRESGIIE